MFNFKNKLNTVYLWIALTEHALKLLFLSGFVRIVANYYLDLESTITNYDDILGIPGDCNPAPSSIYEKVIKAMGVSVLYSTY